MHFSSNDFTVIFSVVLKTATVGGQHHHHHHHHQQQQLCGRVYVLHKMFAKFRNCQTFLASLTRVEDKT